MTNQLLTSQLRLIARPPFYLKIAPEGRWVVCSAVMSVGPEFVTALICGRPTFIALSDVEGCAADPGDDSADLAVESEWAS